MVQEAPLVSVIIVNHNGIDFVDTCLRSVLATDYVNFEVIFVDNASCDGSLQYVKKNFGSNQRLKFVENPGSLGPAVGRNRGSRMAKGKYLIFLDNDTRVTANWITRLVEVLEKDDSIGAAQAKLLRLDTNLYDCAGDYLGPLGFLIERSRGKPDEGQLDFIADILSAKSAASIIRRDLFEKIGRFDEDYYMYLEETDLSWRVWLSGNRVVFIPDSVVYHAFETSKKSFKKYYSRYVVRFFGSRNYILTLIKSLDSSKLFRILLFHIGCWLCISLFFIFRFRFLDAFYILMGLGWHLLNTEVSINKRIYVQKCIRKPSRQNIFKRITTKEKISDYIGKVFKYITYR